MLTRAQAEYSAVARLRGITHSVAEVVSLDHVDLSIRAGDFTALLGTGGSGNSALLRVLAGLEVPTAGLIDVAQEKMIVFGDARLLPWKTVLQNVALGLDGGDAAERARAALADVGFKSSPQSMPAALSAGDALRTSIARALVRNPRLLLLDAPPSIPARAFNCAGLWNRCGCGMTSRSCWPLRMSMKRSNSRIASWSSMQAGSLPRSITICPGLTSPRTRGFTICAAGCKPRCESPISASSGRIMVGSAPAPQAAPRFAKRCTPSAAKTARNGTTTTPSTL